MVCVVKEKSERAIWRESEIQGNCVCVLGNTQYSYESVLTITYAIPIMPSKSFVSENKSTMKDKKTVNERN